MPSLSPLLTASAVELARKIRSREASSHDVVLAHVERAREVNGKLNAIVATRYDEALREAERADAVLQGSSANDVGPLHGVPCTIKECFALEGMPQTSGLVARRDYRAPADATAVRRLRTAGAIPIGVTNTSELCMWMESNNRVYGRTNNPYDVRCIVGGSSGGEGAIIASGASPFGLGSDIGGSIRNPAFFNGIFGHKPTSGTVPNTGQFPLAENAAGRYLVTGPLARRAEDLMPLLRIMAGPDGEDPACEARELGDPAPVSLRGMRVLHVPDNGSLSVSGELRGAQDRVAEHLARQGANVERHHFPRLRRSIEIWSSMLAEAGGTPFGVLLGDGTPVAVFSQLLRWAVGRSPHTLPALGLALIERYVKGSPKRITHFVEEGRRLADEIRTALGPEGVMLYPVYPETAPRHSRPLVPPTRWVYPAILNVLEMPSTAVPLGLGKGGLPLGIQVASAPGNDHVTIAVAIELEHAFGGWSAPGL
jgi:fatty acid amide hydrolase 2